MMTLQRAFELLHPALPSVRLVGDGRTECARVHSDTRTLEPGDLFVALRGERFDAHDFLGRARQAGAAAAIAEHGLEPAGLPGLLVPDSLVALQQLARAWRAQWTRAQLPLIAVTGSNGKTTVTQMIASILRAWHAAGSLATRGNLNNHIGVPLTLLRLRRDERSWHHAAVLELGMNHPGEIAALAALAAPSVALVNNAQREHQEFMVDVEAVARENGAAIEALDASGVAVFPADDAQSPLWHRLAAGRRVITFAGQGTADVTAAASWQADAAGGHWALGLHTPAGAAPVRLRAPGVHNLRNALAAAACALAVGAPLEAIGRGLEAFEPVKGRSQPKPLPGGATLIDDSYNANPDSVRAAIDVLASLPAPRWLVLGDMGEVGERSVQFHAEVGAYARERGIEALWTVGTASRDAAAAYGTQARPFETVAALSASLDQAPRFATVLVKGSRFMQMEQVVTALQDGGAHAA